MTIGNIGETDVPVQTISAVQTQNVDSSAPSVMEGTTTIVPTISEKSLVTKSLGWSPQSVQNESFNPPIPSSEFVESHNTSTNKNRREVLAQSLSHGVNDHKSTTCTPIGDRESKGYPNCHNMSEIGNIPLNYGESSGKYTPFSMRKSSVGGSSVDTGKHNKPQTPAQQTKGEVKTLEVLNPSSMLLNRQSNISCTIPQHPTIFTPVHKSRLVPLYSLNDNNDVDQTKSSTSSHETSVKSGLDVVPLMSVEQGNSAMSLLYRPEPMLSGPSPLAHKAYVQDSSIPHTYQRPEGLIPAHTGTPKNHPKDMSMVHWSTRFEHFSSSTVGRSFQGNAVGHLLPQPSAQLGCPTGHPSYSISSPVPHLYSLPKTTAQLPLAPTQQIVSSRPDQNPVHYATAPMSHSAGNKGFLGTSSTLSAFPYTRQMVLADGQTQNLYLKRSSINIPDTNTTSDANFRNCRLPVTGQSHMDIESKSVNTNSQLQGDSEVSTVDQVLLRKVSEMDKTLQQIEDAAMPSTPSAVPYFVGDHHQLSKHQQRETYLLDTVESMGDANILAATSTPIPKKVSMTSNQTVRKKLRLTPRNSNNPLVL